MSLDLRSISPDNSSTQTSDTTVMVRVTITCNHHLSWPGVTLLDDDLVTDTSTSRVKVNTMLLGESLNLLILLLIGFRLVLHVVIKGKNGLSRVVKLRAGEREELGDDGTSVVVGHTSGIPSAHLHTVLLKGYTYTCSGLIMT